MYRKILTITQTIIILFFYSIVSAEEIIIKGKKESQAPYQLKGEEMRQTPGTLGDALKSIETLPGVVVPGFGSGEVVIRGSDPRSNLYLVDDLPVYYPFHLLGLNSVLSNHLFASMSLHTGAYSPYYGNALGGVISIKTKENVERNFHWFSLSLFSTQVHIERRFGEKHSLTIAGRVSYIEESYGRLNLIGEGIRLPQYNDSQIKYNYDYSKSQKFQFYNLQAIDGFSAYLDPEKESRDSTDSLLSGGRYATSKGFITTAFRHRLELGNLENNASIIRYAPFEKENASLGNFRINTKESYGYKGFRDDFKWNIQKGLKLESGIDLRKLEFISSGNSSLTTNALEDSPNPFSSRNEFQNRSLDSIRYENYLSGYSNIVWKPKKYQLYLGGRYDSVGNNARSITPRVKIEYFTDISGLSFFARAGTTSFYPFDNRSNPRSGNPNLQFEESNSIGGGLKYEWKNFYELQLEGFQQKFSNLIVRDNYAGEYNSPNPSVETFGLMPILPYRKYFFSNSGTGSSEGFEFFLKKTRENETGWNGWISYANSRSKRRTNIHEPIREYSPNEEFLFSKINNSKDVLYGFDQTHILNLVFGYRFNKEWQIGTRWQYRTSFPYTPITGDDGGLTRNPFTGRRVFFPEYSTEINSERFSPYHRLDLRLDRTLPYEWGYMNYYIEFINLYVRRNSTGQQFKTGRPYSELNPSQGFEPTILPIADKTYIPLINFGLEVKF
ncbi:MAG: TonB-dependent receptor plug domain-containing protein [Leptospiraceae bacterium]|nr:TonB-dependent receptor plug domain-containing protein [Leptospiraceae bacterium]